MKKNQFKEKFKYWFDSVMEKGTVTMILLLFLTTLVISAVVGIIVSLICGFSLDEGIWNSLMHTLDAGNLAGNDFGNKANIVFMTVMTAFGLCFTGGLISIINNSFEQKVSDLRRGTSKVMEKDHVVVLGYNYTLFTILEALVEANANQPNQCIVVVGNEDNEVMNAAIKAHIKDYKTTKIRCRSGKIYDKDMLDRASVENARSVIINGTDDKHAIKALLSFKSYIEEYEKKNSDTAGIAAENLKPRVSLVINDERYSDAARTASEGRATVICGKAAISRLIAHSCNQRGLSRVFDELFDYKDNELYFEEIPETIGHTFHDVLFMFEKAIPIGVYSEGKDKKVNVNPDPATEIVAGDMIILFEEDDGAYKDDYHETPQKENILSSEIRNDNKEQESMMDLIILGQNDRLDEILKEYDRVTYKKTDVKILDKSAELKYRLSDYQNIVYEYVHVDDFDAGTIMNIVQEQEFNVLILADYEVDYEEADAESILKLIELKKISDNEKIRFSKTCEIRKSSNKALAEIVGAENFVISSNIGGLMSAQCAENHRLYEVFKELLSAEGSELYMKPAGDFVNLGVPVNFDTAIEAASQKNSVCLGYYTPGKGKELYTCPDRSKPVIFEDGDTLIILSED